MCITDVRVEGAEGMFVYFSLFWFLEKVLLNYSEMVRISGSMDGQLCLVNISR